MLRIDKDKKTLVPLKRSALAQADHWERDLQGMIIAAPDAFCDELGESLWLIGQEVKPSEAVPDRIDILAIDESGASVVIELKRGQHKLQLLQAISYAGMMSRWKADDFVETLAAQYSGSTEDARGEIEEFVGSDASSINQEQRVILVAEDFDPALLIAAEWLNEKYEVDIRCYRMQLSREESGSDYLTCTCIYPPPEIATLTRGGESRQGRTTTAWADWDTALGGIENSALKNFALAEVARKQENRLQYREIIYRIGKNRRFHLGCRTKRGYVWQRGRFEDDVAYWRKLLSNPESVQAVNQNRALRFHLITEADFAAFAKAMRTDLVDVEFIDFAAPQLDEL